MAAVIIYQDVTAVLFVGPGLVIPHGLYGTRTYTCGVVGC